MTTTETDFSSEEQKQLKAFIEILDQAYLSENSAVKDALHKLMMITILCHGHKKSKRGPFKELFNKIKRIENKLDNLKLDQGQKDYDDLRKTFQEYDKYQIQPQRWPNINVTGNDWTTSTTSGTIDSLPNEVTDQLTMDQLESFFTQVKTNNEK